MTKFKVGDRVRTKGYEGTRWDGEGTIVSVDGYYNIVEIDGDRGWFSDHELEPVTLQLEAGKYYRTRDGRKVGPMRRWICEAKHRWEADDDDLPYIWADDGTEIDSDIDDGADLVAEAAGPANDNGSTAGFTVPMFDEDDFDICGHRDSDGDIVQLSVGELTAALADSLKVARKVGKTIKRGDLVVLARPALVTGVDRYHASIQTDGGNYSLPLAALTAA